MEIAVFILLIESATSPHYDCLRDARQAMNSRKAPKASMDRPE
jgi:hypothetical protein